MLKVIGTTIIVLAIMVVALTLLFVLKTVILLIAIPAIVGTMIYFYYKIPPS